MNAKNVQTAPSSKHNKITSRLTLSTKTLTFTRSLPGVYPKERTGSQSGLDESTSIHITISVTFHFLRKLKSWRKKLDEGTEPGAVALVYGRGWELAQGWKPLFE